jgi:dimethylsulfone monooxygenase
MSDGLGDRTASSPAEFSASPLSCVLRQPLILGLFLPVQSGGWSASLLPRTTDLDFRLQRRADQASRTARIRPRLRSCAVDEQGGYGGVSQYREDSLDPFVTVAALSAITDRILLISTVHVLFGPWHPLHLTKFGATIDRSRAGTSRMRGQAILPCPTSQCPR